LLFWEEKEQVSEIRRDDVPPRPGPELWIRRLKKSQKVVATVLGEHHFGFWLHWNGRTTEPCFTDKKKCPGHLRQLAMKWMAYLHIYDHHKREQCFLELTAPVVEMIWSQMGQIKTLRGQRVEFVRGEGDKSRMKCTVLISHPDELGLPPARDPIETLSKLWNLPEGKKLEGGGTDVPDEPRDR
jgi:hypothetical protein